MLYTALRSFHAVASHGGFSSAARALNISQPTLSSQVKSLEDRYDVELFSRIRREVRLTPAGKKLYQTTMQLVQSEAESEDLLNFERASLRFVAHCSGWAVSCNRHDRCVQSASPQGRYQC